MNNLPIRYKLIVLFMLISILPSIGLGFLISWTSDKIIERQVSENTLQLIAKVNKSLEFYVSNLQNMTYLISFNSDVRQFLEKNTLDSGKEYEIHKFLQGFTTLHTEVAGILIMNQAGNYISNELYARTDKSLTEEAWYQEAVRSNGLFKVVGRPAGRNITSHVNYRDDEVISVVRAILDPDTQQLMGVVLVDLKLRVIAETAKDVRLGKTGYLMVIDDKGENIYAPKHPLIKSVSADWFGDGEAASGNISKKINGERLQLIYQKSPFTGWTTVGVFSTRESALEVREINFYLISFVFIVCLLGIAASLNLSLTIARPIIQLKSLMQRAESGDLTSRYHGGRMDEIGLLGRSFNAMIEQIGKLLHLTELQARQKRETEFRALQANIKPHFLYNTLDTIQWMARKQGVEDVAVLVDSLSKLFRIGLSKGSDIISLSDEMEHIQSYLKIQKTRYKDKLSYSIDIDPYIGSYWVLKLILQPLVENAIYHGIKERRGPGHIWIEAKRSGNKLVLKVTDDGKGIAPETLAELRSNLEEGFKEGAEEHGVTEKERSGYGLMNVQARIRLTFGPDYGLSIDSAEGSGTTVTIVHPVVDREMRLEKWGQGI